MGEESKRKAKKSKDKSLCCSKCIHFNNRDKEHLSCGLDGCEVEPDSFCKSFDGTTIRKCDRCHRDVKYTNRDKYYNSFTSFNMTSNNGSGAGQNLHLCHKCTTTAFLMFDAFLEKIKEYNPVEELSEPKKIDEREILSE